MCSLLLKDFFKNQPSAFIQSARDLGLHSVQIMSNIEAATMCMDANVSFKQARIIVGHKDQILFDHLEGLGNVADCLEPEFAEFEYKKENKDKIETLSE